MHEPQPAPTQKLRRYSPLPITFFACLRGQAAKSQRHFAPLNIGLDKVGRF
jgi:hypothetical protein